MNAPDRCPRIDALSALTDDELSGPERVEIEAHAASCAVCAPVLEGMRRLHESLAALALATPAIDVAPDVDRRIEAAAQRGRRRRAPHQRSRIRWWQAAILAPGGALAVTVGFWLGSTAVPGALVTARGASVQMASFSTIPPGALCPASNACKGSLR